MDVKNDIFWPEMGSGFGDKLPGVHPPDSIQ